MSLSDVLSLLGGLALFLYGMNLLGEALERFAGERLKGIRPGSQAALRRTSCLA